MKKLRIFLVVAFFVALFLRTSGVSSAADLTIECPAPNSTCSLSGANPLFTSSDGVWYPGRVLIKTVRVKNKGASGKAISFHASRASEVVEIFEKALLISIVPPTSDSIMFGGNLTNFYDKGRISFGTFDSNEAKEFVFRVSMDQSAGNDTKGKESKFNATMGFWEEPPPAVICTDKAPVSAPTLVSAAAVSRTQVVLSWLPAAGTVTYYAVSYGTSSGSSAFLNPNVGGSSKASYTVGGLTSSTYYFRVRAGNGCAQGAFSNERFISLGQVSEEFPSVLSEEASGTEVRQQEQQEGETRAQEAQEVKGETAPPTPASFIDRIVDFVKKNPVAAAVAMISVSVAAGSVLWQFSRKP